VPLGPNPVATHEVAVGHETPSKPAAAVGTGRETQVSPSSVVVRIKRLRPPLAEYPPPTTTQWLVLTHETAFRICVPCGSTSYVQVLPPSVLAMISPEGAPSPGVASPTITQRVRDAHIIAAK
jgi:hypothetical protein